jgi:hypothetical protein
MVPLRDVTTCAAPRNYTMLCKWLKNCMETHESCRPSGKSSVSDLSCESVALPIRLVDVGSSVGEICPFLAETRGKRGSYLTLSHRWGKHQTETIKDNIHRFKQALPMDELPQTFKDAIIVTRQLGFRYIWIDSLCIIQGDEEDWLRESAKMGDIFESSSCTLAAVHALDDDSNDQGLFLPRNDPLAVRMCCPVKRKAVPKASAKVRNAAGRNCVWKYEWLKKGQEEADISDIIRHNTIVLRPRIASLWYKMQRSEWYNRGWVFQERILSRRIIYYTGDKVYWDCLQEQGDEQGVETAQSSRNAWFSSETMAASTAQSFVAMLAREYSTCELSFRKDNLLAIRGVCNKFGDYYGRHSTRVSWTMVQVEAFFGMHPRILCRNIRISMHHPGPGPVALVGRHTISLNHWRQSQKVWLVTCHSTHEQIATPTIRMVYARVPASREMFLLLLQ